MKEKKKIMLIIFLITIIFNICVFAAVVTTTKRVLVGDADKNNIVDKKDAVMILDKITEEKLNQTTTTEIPLIADTNLDNEINLIDVVDIARYDKAKNEWINSEWITKLEKDIEFGVTQNITIDFSKTNTAKIDVSGKNYGKVLFKSEDTKIVEVDQEGNIIAKNIGETRVIVTESRGGISRTCSIIVEISPTSIKLDKSNIILDLSGTKKAALKATVEPLGSGEHKLTWTSSDENVAVVDQVGNITAKNNGNATISVRTENGKSDTCEVKVQTSPTGIKLDKSNITLDLSGNKTATLNATVEPSTANINNELTWVSEDESIATVDQQGNIIAKKNGNVIIGAITQNGKVNTCEVKVQTSPTGITLDKKNVTLDLSKVKTATLKATIEPSTANVNTRIEWESSDTAVATIDSNGKITAKGNGTTIITAMTENQVMKYCKVEVQTSPTSIKINEPATTLVKETKTLKLATTVEPESANTEIKWSSSDEKVATVDKNGKVTGKGFGKVTITASSTSSNCKPATQELIVGANNNYIDIENLQLGTFARNITTKNNAAMQNFAFEYNGDNGGLLNVYISQESPKNNKKRQINEVTNKLCTENCKNKHTGECTEEITTPEILNVSKLKYDSSGTLTTKLSYVDTMRIKELNHGDSLEYYDNNILTLYPYTDEYKNRKIFKIGYNAKIKENDDIKYKYWNEVTEIEKVESIGLNYSNKKYTTVAVDEKRDIAVIRRGNSIKHEYDIVKLNDLYNSNNSKKDIKDLKITTISHDATNAIKDFLINTGKYTQKDIDTDEELKNVREELGLLNTFQGVDIDGSYIYIYECFREDTEENEEGKEVPKSDVVRKNATFKNNKFGDSFISIYDLGGNCIVYRYNVDKNLAKNEITNHVYLYDIKDNENYKSHEPEGIKVYRGNLYIGLTVKKSSTSYHNILRFQTPKT